MAGEASVTRHLWLLGIVGPLLLAPACQRTHVASTDRPLPQQPSPGADESSLILAAARHWLRAEGDQMSSRGFALVWVRRTQNERGSQYEIGPRLCRGGIEPANDKADVKWDSLRNLCAYLKEEHGYNVVPSSEIAWYFAVCGNERRQPPRRVGRDR
jgi:hypothetical protein